MERVWVYQGDRFLKDDELALIQSEVQSFVHSWTAHGSALDAKAELRENLFLVFSVDERQAGVSGCSIDKSVHFLQSIGQKYNVDFFNRMKVSFKQPDGSVSLVTRSEFEGLLKSGVVDENTIVFNNLIQNSEELVNSWQIPFKDSWHSKVFKI